VAAVLHTGGAGAMVVVLVWVLASTQPQAGQVPSLHTPEGVRA
jgi:hypothetical protein